MGIDSLTQPVGLERSSSFTWPRGPSFPPMFTLLHRVRPPRELSLTLLEGRVAPFLREFVILNALRPRHFHRTHWLRGSKATARTLMICRAL